MKDKEKNGENGKVVLRKNRSANVNVILWNRAMGLGKTSGKGVHEVIEESLELWLDNYQKAAIKAALMKEMKELRV